MRDGVTGVEIYGVARMRDGEFDIALIMENGAEIDMCLGQIRRNEKRRAETLCGGIKVIERL